MTVVVCSIRCGMMCCAYDFTSKDPLPERPAKRACAGIAPKDPLQERPVKPVPFGVRRNFSDRTVLVDATPWHVSVDGRNEELSRCVWENEFLRGRGTLRSREIRVCMFYAGADFARPYLANLSKHLFDRSGGAVDIRFKVVCAVEKWAPACKMIEYINHGDEVVPLFQWAEDMASEEGVARVSRRGRKGYCKIPDHDMVIGGFWCGGYSGLCNNRFVGADVLACAGQTGQSGLTWVWQRNFIEKYRPRYVCIENNKDFDAKCDGDESGVAEAKRQLQAMAYATDHTKMFAMDWGHDPQCRVRVFLNGVMADGGDLLPLERILRDLRPPPYAFPLKLYLHDRMAAMHDVWLSEQKLREGRRPKGNAFTCKEVEQAREQFAAAGLDWPCPAITSVSPNGSCEVSHNPDVWQMPKGSHINLKGISYRAALQLYKKIVGDCAGAIAGDQILWLSSEMSMGWGTKSRMPTGPAPTLTSHCELVIFTIHGAIGPQLRFLSPIESFRLQGCPIESLLDQGGLYNLKDEFKTNELRKMAGQSFHMPSMAAFVLATVLQ